ncbi:zinc ribbon domain-containing protein [bacterium]|nr:zinc ribbon domain-containing protein [bacterium]
MNTCPKCHSEVQPDACFCEACGWPLDKPYPPVSASSTPAQPEIPAVPGSIKERLAVLSGPLRQLKAKWPQRQKHGAKADNKETSEQECQETNTVTKRSGKILNFIVTIVTGVAIIAFWIWLLMRKTAEHLMRCMFKI